jgi:hypothetical protein
VTRLGNSVLGLLLSASFLPAANATPIRPDVKKLLAAPPGSTVQFAPARAGWNGPEAPSAKHAGLNPELAGITAAAARIEFKNAILSALVPDPRITAAIMLTIVFLRRWLMQKREAAQPKAVAIQDNQKLRPAA